MGLEFIIDDAKFEDKEAAGMASGKIVYLPSSYVRRPWLNILKHEIEHCLTDLSGSLTRQINFRPPSVKRESAWKYIHRIYSGGFRADEVEARFAEEEFYTAQMAQSHLVEAFAFAKIQRVYLENFLADLPGLFIETGTDSDGGKFVEVTLRQYPADRDRMPYFPAWVDRIPRVAATFPLPANFPTDWKARDTYVRELFRKRIQELDDMAPRFEPITHLVP